jgi:cysteine synthase A
MKKLAPVLGLIGNTPLVELYFTEYDRTIYAKAEFLNPSGSIKDRFASCVIEHAEQSGALGPGGRIVECTSGNTGIALAMVGAAKGYPVTILMSESASVERRYLMHEFGAEVILFGVDRGYATGIELSKEMAAKDPRVFLPRQFENELNAEDHEKYTGQEILQQMNNDVSAFVAGYGTGGSLTGIGRALRAKIPHVKIYAMEPAEAALLCGEMPCCHFIEGVTGGFIPPLLDTSLLTDEIKVTSDDAMLMTRRLHKEFGFAVGTSSGANIVAALKVATEMGPDSRVVTILCDRAERYFSTRLFEREESA